VGSGVGGPGGAGERRADSEVGPYNGGRGVNKAESGRRNRARGEVWVGS